jgi:hypothetical protein
MLLDTTSEAFDDAEADTKLLATLKDVWLVLIVDVVSTAELATLSTDDAVDSGVDVEDTEVADIDDDACTVFVAAWVVVPLANYTEGVRCNSISKVT